jgi:glycine cleavage system H protein
MEFPENYKYSKSHEWVTKQGETAKIGISDYAQDQLGDLVHLELPPVGATLAAGSPFGSVDSVKAVSDLLSPVSGEVVEVNEDLMESPELVNEDPYTAGWMIIIKMDDPTELDDLMTAEQYERFVEQEA